MLISNISKKPVVVTMGDPSGIGPEVTLKALASFGKKELANFFVIGDASVIEKIKRKTGIRIEVPLLNLDNIPSSGIAYGRTSKDGGRAAMEYIDKAVELVLGGCARAIVTAPVNKASVRLAGFRNFLGHTEYLAEKTRAKHFAMMFVGGKFKITLVTRHVALKDVGRSLSTALIEDVVKMTHKYLREYFNIRSPRIGVAGLNPHAGESGNFGNEDGDIISPAVRRVCKILGNVDGPIAPDVIFYQAMTGRYDAVVSMYHDQALIPFKLLHFNDGVNLTLGLPFVRTSPDHGTAFDIAGSMKADPSSMRAALSLANRLSLKR